MDFALNNLQWLICHKTQRNKQKLSLLDIKQCQFTEEELNVVLAKNKNQKSYRPRWKSSRSIEDKGIWWLHRFCNADYKQNSIEKCIKGCFFPLSKKKKGDLGITKNYRGLTFTAIAAKVNHAFLNRIKPEIKIPRKIQNGFQRNQTFSPILIIRRIIEVRAKNLQATLWFVDFLKAFDFIHSGNME